MGIRSHFRNLWQKKPASSEAPANVSSCPVTGFIGLYPEPITRARGTEYVLVGFSSTLKLRKGKSYPGIMAEDKERMTPSIENQGSVGGKEG